MDFAELRAGATAALVGTLLTVGVADHLGRSPQIAVLAATAATTLAALLGLRGAAAGPSASMAAVTADRACAAAASLLLLAAAKLKLDHLLRRVPTGVTRGVVSGAGIVIVLGFVQQLAGGGAASRPGSTAPGFTVLAFALVMLVEAQATLGGRADAEDLRAVGAGSLVSSLLIGVPATAAAARSRPLATRGTTALVVNVGLTLLVVPLLPVVLAVTPALVISLLLLPSAFQLILTPGTGEAAEPGVVWAITATTVALGGFVVGIVAGIGADLAVRLVTRSRERDAVSLRATTVV